MAVLSMASVAAHADETGFTGFVEGSYLMEDGDRTKPVERFDLATLRDLKSIGADPDGGAFRGGMGYDFGLFDVGLRYEGTWLSDRQGVSSDLAASIIHYGQLNVHLANAYFLTDGTIKEDHDRHVIDLLLGYDAFAWDGGSINLSGGLRYANIDHDLTVHSELAGVALIEDDRTEDFAGVGPAINATGQMKIADEFRLVGGVGGSVIFGDRDTHNLIRSIDPATGAIVQSFEEERDGADTIYNMSGELGVAYVPFMPGGTEFMVTLGYRMDAWWNVQDTTYSDFQDAVPTTREERGSRNGDALSHGPFLRLGVRF